MKRLLVGVAALGATTLGTSLPAIASAPPHATKVLNCKSVDYKPDVLLTPKSCATKNLTKFFFGDPGRWTVWTASEAKASGSWVRCLDSKCANAVGFKASFLLDKPAGGVFRQLVVTFPHGHPSGVGRVATFTLPASPVTAKPTPTPTPTPTPAPTTHACTTTSSGSCIRGGEFCPVADEGQYGYDASGDKYICEDSDNDGHPHWEVP